MNRKTGYALNEFDTPELPGHFAVWLCSDEAKFLRGKFLWTNWDAEEIIERRPEIEGTLLLTATCMGTYLKAVAHLLLSSTLAPTAKSASG